MLNLLKHLKPFISSMILAIALLFVQAICDLSLPDYMSNIVNVGIQQGGVENAVPKVIKASEMKKLFIFINSYFFCIFKIYILCHIFFIMLIPFRNNYV